VKVEGQAVQKKRENVKSRKLKWLLPSPSLGYKVPTKPPPASSSLPNLPYLSLSLSFLSLSISERNPPCCSLLKMASSSSALPTLSASSLSSSSTKEIETPVAPGTYKPTPQEDIDAVYDIQGTIAHLGRVVPPAKSVSLQFPDHLLIDSVEVFRRIQKGLDGFGHGGRAFVLADTTYGR